MALTTQSVAGTFYYPDGSPMAGAYILITLSNSTVDTVSPSTLPPTQVETTLNGSGVLSVDLWPNERGYDLSFYTLSVSYIDTVSGNLVKTKVGNFQVPDSTGPHDIEALLEEQILATDDWGLITQSVTTYDNWGSI